jgi:demethylspheroidene O-methyltransferase
VAAEATRPGTAWRNAGWLQPWRVLRDRVLSDPGFQRWASRFPLTRPVARRHAAALFDLCSGFIYSQVLLACVRLRLLESLRVVPQDTGQLAQQLAIPVEALQRLLEAACALALVERRGACWGLGTVGAALLGSPAVQGMIEHHGLLYDDLRDPLALLRSGGGNGRLAALWPYARHPQAAGLPPSQVAAYTSLMAATQPLVAGELLDAYPFARHRVLLDVGGGNGSFLLAAAARVPGLRLMLFDLPAVAASARERLAEAGLGARASVFGGDFAREPLPGGADLVTLVRVLHDHDDAAARLLLRRAREALAPGGRIVIAEPMAATRGSVPGMEAYFAIYLLAMGQGRARTEAEVRQLLASAGFSGARSHPVARPWQCAVVSARAGKV